MLNVTTCQVRHNLLNKQDAEAHLAGLVIKLFFSGLTLQHSASCL